MSTFALLDKETEIWYTIVKRKRKEGSVRTRSTPRVHIYVLRKKRMETVLLLTPQTWGNDIYDDDWFVFEDWLAVDDIFPLELNMGFCLGRCYNPTTGESGPFLSETSKVWQQIYTFQLLVKEARKDELLP